LFSASPYHYYLLFLASQASDKNRVAEENEPEI